MIKIITSKLTRIAEKFLDFIFKDILLYIGKNVYVRRSPAVMERIIGLTRRKANTANSNIRNNAKILLIFLSLNSITFIIAYSI